MGPTSNFSPGQRMFACFTGSICYHRNAKQYHSALLIRVTVVPALFRCFCRVVYDIELFISFEFRRLFCIVLTETFLGCILNCAVSQR